MIGWYVDVGYLPKSPEGASLEEVTWLDRDVPMTISTLSTPTTWDSHQWGLADASEEADKLLANMETDYYYSYAIPATYITKATVNVAKMYETIFRALPPARVYPPNTWQFVIDNPSEWGVAVENRIIVYFKKQQKLICYRGSTQWFASIVDGKIKLENMSFIWGFSGVDICIPFIVGDYNSPDAKFYMRRIDGLIAGTLDRWQIEDIGLGGVDARPIKTLLTVPPDFDKLGPNNPYEPGGPSVPGGGDGSFDNDSDQIVDSSLPTISSANTGFTRIYNPSLSQVQALARYLWTDESVIQTIWNHIKQYFEDPMQAIIGFNLVPVPVPNGGTQNFALMYIDTGVEMTVAASQFVDVDCGTFELKEYYGSALDYAPNTKVSCFLPFIGTVSLNTDEVMGRTLQVKYRVDICSGSCVAKIAVDGNFIYQYSGHCAINIPISSADFSSYVSSAISVAQLAAGAIAAGAGGVMASTAVDATQQTNQVVTTTQITNTARNPATGRQITTGTMTRVETRESPNDQSSTQASFSGLTPQNISNTVGQIMSSKPNINHSGSFSGNSGYLGVRRPFLIIERPNMCMPSNFQTLNGFPSMITLELSSCTGFTRVQQVQLTGFYATNPEQAEILQLLKSGVIL